MVLRLRPGETQEAVLAVVGQLPAQAGQGGRLVAGYPDQGLLRILRVARGDYDAAAAQRYLLPGEGDAIAKVAEGVRLQCRGDTVAKPVLPAEQPDSAVRRKLLDLAVEQDL